VLPTLALQAAPKRERRKDARPSEILDAALDVFAERGFAAAKLDEVAARAGVSKGTLYLYFTSKEELFKAVVRKNIVSMLAEGRAMIASWPGNTADLLREFMIEWWRRKGETKVSAIPKVIMAEARNFPDIAAFYVEEVISPAHEMIASIFERGVARGEFVRPANMEDAVHSVVSAVLFLVNWKHSFACCVAGSEMHPERFLVNHANLLIEGLAVRERVAAPKRTARHQ
jgi:AcrR family transcriptional regulator